MVLRALLLAGMVAMLGSAPALADGQERACRSIEMRLMQLQASGKGDGGEAGSVRGMLASRGCAGGSRAARAEPRRRETERSIFRITRAPARVARVARQPAAAKPARRATVPKVPRQVVAAKQDGGATGRSRRPRSAPTAPEPALPAAEGTFRTWCVRACDGYYFPISYSTTKDQFETDQETCQAMCPAGEAGLYFHDAKEGGPENMTSTEGQAYSDLEAAFRYRTAIDRSCTCTAGGARPLPALDAQGPVSAPGPVALTPRPRPAPGEDPETLLNRAGRFNPGVPQPAIASSGGALGSSVRVVWPDWQAEQSEVLISAVPSY